jgi:hypothetical protein
MARRSFEIRDIVEEFVTRLSSLIEHDTVSRAREAVLSTLGGRAATGASLGLGRNGVAGMARAGRPPGRKRRKGPIQLCPVPGCKNRAAPVFGMVCAQHKNVSKTQIKKYREQRRAQKVSGTPARKRGTVRRRRRGKK